MFRSFPITSEMCRRERMLAALRDYSPKRRSDYERRLIARHMATGEYPGFPDVYRPANLHGDVLFRQADLPTKSLQPRVVAKYR